jgi:hypothetical protein
VQRFPQFVPFCPPTADSATYQLHESIPTGQPCDRPMWRIYACAWVCYGLIVGFASQLDSLSNG